MTLVGGSYRWQSSEGFTAVMEDLSIWMNATPLHSERGWENTRAKNGPAIPTLLAIRAVGWADCRRNVWI